MGKLLAPGLRVLEQVLEEPLVLTLMQLEPLVLGVLLKLALEQVVGLELRWSPL